MRSYSTKAIKIFIATLLLAASPVSAGIWGVPTNLNANGTTSGTSANPPGWITIERQNAATLDGDSVHQIRFFIEVTGTTLDIKVFDPGSGPSTATTTSGARDQNDAAPPNTRYTLYTPAGAIYNPAGGTAEGGPKNITSDLVAAAGGDAITEDRLVRFSCNSGAAPTWTAANAGAAFGNGAGSCATALAPGVWIFEATITGTTTGNLHINALGVSITDAAGNSYNVYTTALSDANDAVATNETAFLVGTANGGAPTAAIAEPMVLYPYVNRGCSISPINFDADINSAAGDGGSGNITDPLGTTTTLTMSVNDGTATDTITVEPAAGFNLTSTNYGLFTVESVMDNIAGGQNVIDWRFADWRGATAGAASGTGGGLLLPSNPTDPIRTYLPNSYSACSFAAGCTMGAPPAEPYLTNSAVVVSGPNPPVPGSTTRYLVSASVYNPTSSPLATNYIVQPILVTPLTNITNAFVAGTDACFVNGAAATCTFTNGTDNGGAGTADNVTFRRAQLTTPATLVAGATFTYQYQVDVAVGAAFSAGATIPITPAPAALSARAVASDCSDAPANVNRTVNSCYTPAFSSATFDRVETLGPVCDLRTATGSAAAVTAARIRAFSANSEGVAFSVVSQRRTAAFRVFSLVGNRRALLGTIKALQADSLAPMVYSLPRPAPTGLFEIEEVEEGGALRRYGPFAGSDSSAAAQVARMRLKLQAAGAQVMASEDGEVLMMPSARSASLVRSFQGAARSKRLRSERSARFSRPRFAGIDGLRISVKGSGPVRVSREDLLAAGLPDSARTGRLRVWNLGAPVAATVDAPGTPQEALVFEASELSTTYSSENSYVVTWGGLPRPSAPSVAFSSEAAPRAPHTERVEKSMIYLASAPGGADPWVWDYVSPGNWPLAGDSTTAAFDLPGLVTGTDDVPVTIHLTGGSPHRHTVSAAINGLPVGEVTFTGRGLGVLQGSVPASALLAAGNALALSYSPDAASADDVAAVFLDAIDLGVTLNRSDAVVTEIESYDAGFSTRPADYLVVTHSAFASQAEEIVALKNAQGFRARAVDVDRIYDTFSGGVVEATAIQKALQSVPGLKYALLVGDDTIDYRNYYGLEPFPVVPSLLDWETESGRVPSENRYADFDDDGAPEIAIGRLPVQTADEANTAVAKIRRQGQVMAANRGKYLFVTDNQGPTDPGFRANADAVAAGLPRTARVTFADASFGVQTARDAIVGSLSSGVAVTSYFGHGSPDAWADEGILSSDDLSALSGLKETLVLMWACQSQYFTYFYGPSLGEALFLLPEGGAIASVGPAGISSTEHQKPLYDAFYRQLAAGKSVGEALKFAKRQVVSEFAAGSGLVGFNLIGDPSLRP